MNANPKVTTQEPFPHSRLFASIRGYIDASSTAIPVGLSYRLLRQNPGPVLQRRHARDLPPLKYSNTHWRHIHSAVAKAMADKTTPVGQSGHDALRLVLRSSQSEGGRQVGNHTRRQIFPSSSYGMIRAWLFGNRLRWQVGKTVGNLMTSLRPKV